MKAELARGVISIIPENETELQVLAAMGGVAWCGHWGEEIGKYYLCPEHKMREQDRGIFKRKHEKPEIGGVLWEKEKW